MTVSVGHTAYCPRCGTLDKYAVWKRKSPEAIDHEETIIVCENCGYSSVVDSFYPEEEEASE